MSKKSIVWLYGQLPELIKKGVISGETADSLKNYYGLPEKKDWKQVILTIFGVLGAVFVGLGIILILANNWTQLSRPVRTVISFLPLLIGQLLCGFTLLKKPGSAAWREGSAIFLMAAVGASISLISQTYHISGDIGDFILTWMLLSLPLVYIMKVSLVAFLYLIGITFWAGFEQASGGQAVFFWLMFSLLIPEFYYALREDSGSNRSLFISWALTLCLCVAIGITLEKVLPGLWLIIYSSYFSILLLTGSFIFKETDSAWGKPFQVVGLSGILTLAFIFTYRWPWREVGWQYYHSVPEIYTFAAIADYLLAISLPTAALYLMTVYIRKNDYLPVLISGITVLSVAAFGLAGLAGNNMAVLNMLIFNIFLFTLGIVFITRGIKAKQIGMVNSGMLIISLLIVLRFFDMGIGFAVRGLIFIIIGTAFFITNYLLVRKVKGEAV